LDVDNLAPGQENQHSASETDQPVQNNISICAGCLPGNGIYSDETQYCVQPELKQNTIRFVQCLVRSEFYVNRYAELIGRLVAAEKILIDGATGTEIEHRGVPQLHKARNGGEGTGSIKRIYCRT